ncbi:GNAT family N-acetyltransferase [Lysinibacillus sp. BF-4]|uniref:GNAT family N-acetyltransferase n=1 Tax=Lysinibacillus sp. BF-4 TaxID=1473546 RepID=UPI00068BB4CE|nr:GNAT family protein [Lysinibacillus sp. BF-4]
MLNWLLRFLPQRSPRMMITGERCFIRIFKPSDADELAQFLFANKEAWSTFEPIHSAYYYTAQAQRKKIIEGNYLAQRNREFTFGVFVGDILVGHIALYSIKRMPYKSGFIGYAMAKDYVGQGIMTEAIKLVQRFAFERLELHRLEAYVAPQNLASRRVLIKTGFAEEGLLRKLLWLNGKWEDHYMYAMLRETYKKR